MHIFPKGTFPYIIQPYDTIWSLAHRFNTTIDGISFFNPEVDLNRLEAGQIIHIYPGYMYHSRSRCISKGELELYNHLRMLWEQHVVWTRLTIISIAFDLPDVELVTNRLLRNPIDFEMALGPFYGGKIASEFSGLLENHLVIAAELVKAAKAGDDKAADAEKRWYANADKIAAFLGCINPYWFEEEWKSMLYEHLSLIKSEAVNILTKNYGDSISVYDEIEIQALKMADVMAEGIAKQFSYRFTRCFSCP